MKRLWKQFNKTILGSTTILFVFIITLLLWLFTPFQQVPMWVVILVLVVAYGVCIVVYAISSEGKERIFTLPKVLAIHKREDKITLIVEESELLFYNAMVSIFFHSSDTGFETFLGNGYVETINREKNRQVIFIDYSGEKEAQNIVSRLSNDNETARSLIVKLSISIKSFERSIL